MKNFLNRIYLLALATATLMACEKDEEQLVATTTGAPTLNVSAQTLELQASEANNEAVVFSWTPVDVAWTNPDIAPEGAMRYFLQFDQQGENFASPVEIDMGTELERRYTVSDFNAFVRERLELETSTPSVIEVRVKAAMGPNVEGATSAPVTLTVTPYEEVRYAPIYMVGDATEHGWDNALATPMFISNEAPGMFVYTGMFTAGGFKFLKLQGQWAPMWGVDGVGGLVARPTEADPDPNTITVAAEGYYTVTVDTVNMTYTFEPFNALTAPTYESIGVIGAFSDWSSDVLMTRSAFDPHIWMLEHDFAADTELKFRKAGDWGVNWGPATEEERAIPYGTGVQDGRNINLLAGSYTIYFNDLTGQYMFLKN
jgi:hypothetical protein